MEQTTMPEAQPMSARYRISESDYVRARGLSGWAAVASVWSGLFLFILLLVLMLVFLMGFQTWAGLIWGQAGKAGIEKWIWGEGLVPGVSVGRWILTIVGAWMVGWFIGPRAWHREYRQYKAMHDEYVVTWLSDRMRITSPSGEFRLVLSKILKWRCNANYVLVYTMPRGFFIIPTTVAEQGFDIDRLKTVLTQHVGPEESWQ